MPIRLRLGPESGVIRRAARQRNKGAHCPKMPTKAAGALTAVSSEDALHGVAFNHLARLIEMIVDGLPRVQAYAVINGRQQIVGMDRVLNRRGTRLIRFAVYQAALDAGPRGHRGVAIGSVIAAGIVVDVA